MGVERPRAARGLPAVAAGLPLLFILVGCGLLAVGAGASGGGILQSTQAVVGLPLLLLVTSLGVVLTSGALLLCARGRAVPTAVPVVFAALPWLAGLAGARIGARIGAQMTWDAIGYADPAQRAALMAMWIADANVAHLAGAGVSAALLAAVAFGLAIGAVGQRAEGRSAIGGAIGFALAAPLLGMAGYGLYTVRGGGLLLAVAGAGAPIAAAIGGAGIGDDGARGRSGALGAAVPVAAGLAVLAAAAAAHAGFTRVLLAAIAMGDPNTRMDFVLRGAHDLGGVLLAARWALPAGLVAGAGLAGWSALRSTPRPGHAAGVGALLIVAGGLFFADHDTTHLGQERLEAAGRAEWMTLEGLQPVTLASPSVRAVDAVLTPSGLVSPDGARLSGTDTESLAPAVATLVAGTPREPVRAASELQQRWRDPELAIAVDRRVDGTTLSALFAALAASEIDSVDLVGRGEGLPEDVVAASRDALPALTALVGQQPTGVRIVAGDRLFASIPREDPILFHARVGDVPPGEVETRPGAHAGAQERRMDRDSTAPEPERPLYLELRSATTAQVVVRTAEDAVRSGFIPIVVRDLDPLLAPAPVPDDEAIRDATATGGSLPREVIQRVIRSHISEIRSCYERELARDPSLGGRVVVRFVVSPQGTVSSAEVATSTLASPPVERCVTDAVLRWTFPEPAGGGAVGVSYPFVLQSAP